MVPVAERSTAFSLTSGTSAQLPAVATGTIVERFEELRQATTQYRSDLRDALQRIPASAPAREARQEGLFQRFRLFALIGGTLGAFAAGVFASRQKALPPPDNTPSLEPPRDTLDDVLARVHDTQKFSPTTLVALSAMAQEQLDAEESKHLPKGAKDSLAEVVWHGEMQDRTEIARSARWVELQRALDGLKYLGQKSDRSRIFSAFEKLTDTFQKLEPDEREALASVIRDAAFDGCKPRWPLAFTKAKDLYDALRAASPLPIPPVEDVPAPPGGESFARLGREVYAFEEALCRALDPAQRRIEGVLRALHHSEQIGMSADPAQPLGFDLGRLRRDRDLRNDVLDAAAIASATSRALAPWHSSIERAALALVAKRAIALLDGACILGSEARSMLSSVMENGAVAPESVTEATVKDAARLYKVLDSFNGIEASSGSESLVTKALSSFNENTQPLERAGLALALRERVFGVEMRTKDYFPGAVNLFRELRAAIEDG